MLENIGTEVDAMHLKHEVVAQILGIQVYVDLSVIDCSINPTRVPARVSSFSPELSGHCAIMLPSEHHMLTFIIDGLDSVFVHTDLCPDSLFTAQTKWNFLARMFGSDSVIHCVFYRDASNALALGVFDATRLSGVDLSAHEMLERHVKVHDIVHSSVSSELNYHWMGYARNCYEHIRSPEKPFHAHQMLVFTLDGNRRVLASLSISSTC